MIAKKILLIMRRNGMLLLGAAIVASWIFYVVNNPDIFTASVLSLQEKQFIVEKWRDIAYKTNSWAVDIFMSEELETPASIDFTISFDKDAIIVDTQNLSGQGTRVVNNPNSNDIVIQSTPGQNVDKSQSIIILPFTGDNTDILLSEAVAKLSNGETKDLSIGSLNEITSHSNQ